MKKMILTLLSLGVLLSASDIGIKEKLGDTVPLDAVFINEELIRVPLELYTSTSVKATWVTALLQVTINLSINCFFKLKTYLILKFLSFILDSYI